MPENAVGAERRCFRDLYADALWSLRVGASIMKLKLPLMADAISYPELAAVLRDAVAVGGRAEEQLAAMLSHFAEPARVHAAELETLIGEAARRYADWPRGDAHDVVLSTVVRAVIHTSIPACELAITLAAAIGFPQHVGYLKVLRSEMQTTDEKLRQIGDERIRAAHAASTLPAPPAMLPQLDAGATA